MSETPEKRRANDGGTYLVIADDSPEFALAFAYAVRMASLHRGYVAMARIDPPTEFTGWGKIDSAARSKAREDAEAAMQALASRVKAESGITPTLILREGDPRDEIVTIARQNPSLSAIVLACGRQGSAANPLLTYFTAKGLSKLPVPLIIVPGHLRPEDISRLL